MKILLYYLGLVLELIGMATMMAVIILFFGETKMQFLLNMSILGVAEFYAGFWLIGNFHKRN